MGLLKLLSSSEIIAQLINFLVLLFVLRVLAWKKIINFLDDRRARIAFQVEEVERLKLESAALKAKADEQIKNIEAIAMRKLKEAEEAAQSLADDIKKDARKEAERIMAQAQSNVRYEATRIKNELKNEIIDMVMQVSEQMIEHKMDPQTDRKLAEEFLANLDEAK